ncbi:hypothetical protein D9M72_596710 [compost metagenome]
MGGIDGASCLQLAHNALQDVPWTDGGHGHLANEGEHVLLQPGLDLELCPTRSFGRSLSQPFATHSLECVCRCVGSGLLFLPLGRTRIHALGK